MADDPLDRVKEGLHEGIHALKRRTRVLGEFKTFISRGSALDLAIGVVIGAAFTTVVQSLVRDVLSPIVSIPGTANFDKLYACLKDVSPRLGDCAVTLAYGRFITAIVSFLLTSAAVFFFVVRPMNTMRGRRKEDGDEPVMKTCPQCLSDVPFKALRCRACTVELTS